MPDPLEVVVDEDPASEGPLDPLPADEAVPDDGGSGARLLPLPLPDVDVDELSPLPSTGTKGDTFELPDVLLVGDELPEDELVVWVDVVEP